MRRVITFSSPIEGVKFDIVEMSAPKNKTIYDIALVSGDEYIYYGNKNTDGPNTTFVVPGYDNKFILNLDEENTPSITQTTLDSIDEVVGRINQTDDSAIPLLARFPNHDPRSYIRQKRRMADYLYFIDVFNGYYCELDLETLAVCQKRIQSLSFLSNKGKAYIRIRDDSMTERLDEIRNTINSDFEYRELVIPGNNGLRRDFLEVSEDVVFGYKLGRK